MMRGDVAEEAEGPRLVAAFTAPASERHQLDAPPVFSEPIYKAYEPGPGPPGVPPLVEVLGRPVLSPSEIVRQFNRGWERPPPSSSSCGSG